MSVKGEQDEAAPDAVLAAAATFGQRHALALEERLVQALLHLQLCAPDQHGSRLFRSRNAHTLPARKLIPSPADVNCTLAPAALLNTVSDLQAAYLERHDLSET